jgi:hypothetical protein
MLNLGFDLPDFISPLMKQWLIEYKLNQIKDLTHLGLFNWKFRPNKRLPEKPRRIPILNLDKRITLLDSSFSRSVYFLQIDTSKLHVFESSGFSMAGMSLAKEYFLECDNKFTEGKVLYRTIS